VVEKKQLKKLQLKQKLKLNLK